MLQAGQVLLAEPFLQDPNFKRSVVFLCEHQAQKGSFGLILNRPLQYRLGDAIQELIGFDVPLYFGGPMGLKETLHYLHGYGDLLEDSIQVTKDIYWGGNFNALKQYIHAGVISPHHIRFFTGYAGWGAGQLEEEMETESWFLTPAQGSFAFEAREHLWKEILEEMGGKYRMIANYPEDPRLN